MFLEIQHFHVINLHICILYQKFFKKTVQHLVRCCYFEVEISIVILLLINNGGEFQKPYKEIYPKELDLKLEYSGYYAIFLDIYTTISNGNISSKLYDKYDDFSCFIV